MKTMGMMTTGWDGDELAAARAALKGHQSLPASISAKRGCSDVQLAPRAKTPQFEVPLVPEKCKKCLHDRRRWRNVMTGTCYF